MRMSRLTEYLIQTADGPAYRSGNLDGMRHPAVDGKMIQAVGGLRKLLEEAGERQNVKIWGWISCVSIIRSA